MIWYFKTKTRQKTPKELAKIDIYQSHIANLPPLPLPLLASKRLMPSERVFYREKPGIKNYKPCSSVFHSGSSRARASNIYGLYDTICSCKIHPAQLRQTDEGMEPGVCQVDRWVRMDGWSMMSVWIIPPAPNTKKENGGSYLYRSGTRRGESVL